MIRFFSAIQKSNLALCSSNKQNKNIEQTKKPLLAYMDLYFEPKNKHSLGFGDFFEAAIKTCSDIVKSSESKSVEDSAKETAVEKTEQTTAVKEAASETILETKKVAKKEVQTSYLYEENTYSIQKTHKKRKRKRQNSYQEDLKLSIGERITKIATKVAAYPLQAFSIIKNAINSRVEKVQLQLEEKKALEKSKAAELKRWQQAFDLKLKKYKIMFTSDDIIPDLSIFSYKKLSLMELKNLSKVLDGCIAHQGIIISLKKKFLHDASTYVNKEQEENIHKKSLYANDIGGPRYTDKQNYRKNLDKMYEKFLNNSKEIETPILDFNQISNNFFTRAKSSIEEIFEMKKKWYFKYLERIPKLGLVPKSIRVTGQINLTRCIMKDYKGVTDRYITNGMNPMIQKYNKQYEKIKKFTEYNQNILSDDDLKYTDTILSKIAQIRAKRLESYKKLFDIYTRGGCNISNICNTVRMKGLISLITKTISTFGSPF